MPRTLKIVTVSLALFVSLQAQLHSAEAPALSEVVEQTTSNDAKVRGNAIWRLGDFGKDGVRTLIKTMNSLEDGWVLAAAALGKIGADAVPELIQNLSDPEKRIRARASRAMFFLGRDGKDAIPQLIELLADSDDFVSGNAARALGKMDAANAALKIAELLNSRRSAMCRSQACYALIDLGKSAAAAIPTIVNFLNSNELLPREQIEVAQTLFAIGETKVSIDLCSKYLNSDDEWLQSDAARALQLAGPEAKPFVPKLKSLLSQRLGAENAAVALLCIAGDESGAAVLDEALKDKHLMLRLDLAERLVKTSFRDKAFSAALDALSNALNMKSRDDLPGDQLDHMQLFLMGINIFEKCGKIDEHAKTLLKELQSYSAAPVRKAAERTLAKINR